MPQEEKSCETRRYKAIVFPIYNWRRFSDTLKCFYCRFWGWWSRYWQRGLNGFWPVIICIISRLVQQTISETEVFGRIPELMKKSSKVVVMMMMMMLMMMWATIHWWSWCLRVTAIQSLAGCETTNFNSSTSQLYKYNEGSFTSLPCLSL